MSRRRRAVHRPIAEDGKYHSVLVARLINKVMKWGQKSKAQKIVHGAFDIWPRRIQGLNLWQLFNAPLIMLNPVWK